MERWNELIAGHVLGNLTEEEEEELAKVLANRPQLMGNIARLRKTATLRSLRRPRQLISRTEEGLEGWSDTATQLNNDAIPDAQLLNPKILQSGLLSSNAETEALINSARLASSDLNLSHASSENLSKDLDAEPSGTENSGTENSGAEHLEQHSPTTIGSKLALMPNIPAVQPKPEVPAPASMYQWSHLKQVFTSVSVSGWVMLLALGGLVVDNWQLRRSLNTAQQRIADLETYYYQEPSPVIPNSPD